MLDDELIERMRGTVDRAEIIECLHTYARAMDRFDRELARSVYHEGATDDHGNFRRARARVHRMGHDRPWRRVRAADALAGAIARDRSDLSYQFAR